ncbi:MAG TPA: alpha/beta hydrolase [Blastocatellia bacterium]|nr:alpha/beta hydrolase [Blastocatellia bacterium]
METLFPPSQKKSGFFALPRTVRLAIYLPFCVVLFFFFIRAMEWKMTHHPVSFDSDNPKWVLPRNAEEAWLTTADGVKLHAWFLRARQQPTKGTVLYSHGNGGNLTYVRGTAETLAQRGLDVLIYDYRGYGRSEGSEPNETELYADGDAAYEYLTKTRGVPPSQLVLYGLSLGTTVATDLASRRPCQALVLEAPLSSASDMATATLPLIPAQLHWILRNRFESARKIATVKCSVLITHGDADEVIPVEQGRKVFAAAPEPKKLLIVPRGTHWLLNEQGYFDAVVDFIHTNLAGKQ